MQKTHFQLTLPAWAAQKLAQSPLRYATIEERMQIVLDFAEENINHESGGPFAAGVFEQDSGKLVAMGVNRVVPSNCSSAHAEIMALSLAQQTLDTYDLGGEDMPAHQLVVNWCPCAMCFGAVLWSGIRSLVIAGAGKKLEQITGFDEGPMPPEWKEELRKRGISLQENILHQLAVEQFERFAESGQPVYNGRQGQR
ncbi:nucleoside deaminase [Desulfogranum japonicum]|uniref:nucleoside deaminase n=1 Tax=Desulfogranum japonicum TaxID=231447 RepID=UPI00040BB811|nr:nucleoside deaminase [Desulfogranum japonicum]